MKFVKLIKADENLEETATCAWCDEEFPISDLFEEKDFGYLCDKCKRALKSRGEKIVKAEDEEEQPIWRFVRREIADDVAKNYTQITGVDVNDLFTKVDDLVDGKTFSYLYNVDAKLFDKQLPKIYKWIKQKYNLDKEDYNFMIYEDSHFLDLIIESLENFADINKVKYDKDN